MPNGNGWTVERKVSIGNIITMTAVLLAAAAAAFRLEGRVDINESRIDVNKSAIVRVEAESMTQYTEIIRRLERISDKLMDINEDK